MKRKTFRKINRVAFFILILGLVICTEALSADSQSPTCRLSAEDPGPPFTMKVTFQDTGSGLKAINILQAVNATVYIPPFAPGIINLLTVTITKIDQGNEFSITLEAEDVAGNFTTCTFPESPPPPPQDVEAPSVEITSTDPGPPFTMEVTFQDTGSGLKAINILQAVNATVSIPPFAPGTVDPVMTTVTQINQSQEFGVRLEAEDVAGNLKEFRYPTALSYITRPEFDAVGKDSDNFFDDYFKRLVTENGRDGQGNKINELSNFVYYENGTFLKEISEHFETQVGFLFPDPCFSTPVTTYLSGFAPTWTEGSFQWQIILQMKPEADLRLNIVSCVLRTDEIDPWNGAEQSARYRTSWAPNQPFFVPSASPTVTVEAFPGPYAVIGFPEEGFYLDSRAVPGMGRRSLEEALYTAEGLVEEGIVIVLPQTGATNSYGQTEYTLRKGDRIRIRVAIPYNNMVDIYYGSDNVVLRYIGLVGSEYITSD